MQNISEEEKGSIMKKKRTYRQKSLIQILFFSQIRFLILGKLLDLSKS